MNRTEGKGISEQGEREVWQPQPLLERTKEDARDNEINRTAKLIEDQNCIIQETPILRRNVELSKTSISAIWKASNEVLTLISRKLASKGRSC
jgi:hypothetical protein